MRTSLSAVVLALVALATPTTAAANCQTHHCWQHVHVHRVERVIERRIDKIALYRCGPAKSVVPCSIIDRESATDGYWLALNGGHNNPDSRPPCSQRACGLYQFLGWRVPWPVIVTWGPRLWRHYRSLKNELTHDRLARRLWGQQQAGAACHWCY
jgi:hypothetical protein